MSVQPLVVHIPHSLGREEAVRRMKRGFARASTSVPFLEIECEEWSGERLTFSIKGISKVGYGECDVSDNDVRVEVILPWLLQQFAELAGKTIESRARVLLEKK